MPLNEDQTRKYNFLSKVVLNDIERREEELKSHLRLNYSLQLSQIEKNDYTQKRLTEIKEIIGKLEGDLADYIQTAIVEDLYGFNNPTQLTLISNFVAGQVLEEDLIHVDDDDEEYEYLGFDFNISDAGRDYSIIKEFIEAMALTDIFQTLKIFIEDDKAEMPPKKLILRENKSILLEGKALNVSERVKIANEVLDFEGKIRKLNISDTEKYQLMAYIIGNDVSNIRNVVNGTRHNKIREKEINSYLNDLMK